MRVTRTEQSPEYYNLGNPNDAVIIDFSFLICFCFPSFISARTFTTSWKFDKVQKQIQLNEQSEGKVSVRRTVSKISWIRNLDPDLPTFGTRFGYTRIENK